MHHACALTWPFGEIVTQGFLRILNNNHGIGILEKRKGHSRAII